jgi:hypothetical protein
LRNPLGFEHERQREVRLRQGQFAAAGRKREEVWNSGDG